MNPCVQNGACIPVGLSTCSHPKRMYFTYTEFLYCTTLRYLISVSLTSQFDSFEKDLLIADSCSSTAVDHSVLLCKQIQI